MKYKGAFRVAAKKQSAETPIQEIERKELERERYISYC